MADASVHQSSRAEEGEPTIGRSLIDGTVRNLIAEILFPITALITAAYLTRQLGPDGYGRLTLVVSLVAWVEWAINSFFSRTVVKHVGEAKDWRPLGTAAVQLQLRFGLAALLGMWVLAYPLALLFHDPVMVGYLLLLAIDIPLFVLAQAHRHLLLGMGNFGVCASASAARWVMRLFLILGLVAWGWSIYGVLLGILGSTLVELWMLRRTIRPSLIPSTRVRDWPLWNYSIPLFISALSVATLTREDLFFLRALRPDATSEVGWYGASQNLSMLPGLLGMTMVPILLSSLSRLRKHGEVAHARLLTVNAFRVVLALLPVMALIGGCADELVVFLFGSPFEPAGRVLAPLMLGGTALMLLSVAMTVLIAEGYPGGTVVLTVPMVLVAATGHWLWIPQYGMDGAALVTAGTALLGAILGMLWAVRAGHTVIPWATIARSIGLAVGAFLLADWWATPGPQLLIKLSVVSGLIVGGYWVLRELSTEEISLLWDVLSEPVFRKPTAPSRLMGRNATR